MKNKAHKKEQKEENRDELMFNALKRTVESLKNVLKSQQNFCFGELETPLFKVGEEFFQYPLSKSHFRKIKEFCQDTPFGSGEKTLFDDRIRKGWQINPKDISIDHTYLEKVLEDVEKFLKKPNVTAEFYKLLIYEKEGHFKKHKDTLRDKHHFGTLLIFLPSEFEGGDFVLYDKTESKSFNYSISDPKRVSKSLKTHWLAFYTDSKSISIIFSRS